MAGAPATGKLSKTWSRGGRERVAEEQAAHRVCSWTVQNVMRGVRRRCMRDPRFYHF